MDELFKAQFDDSEIIASLDKIEKQLIETGKAGEQAGRALDESFDAATDQVNAFESAIEKSSKATADQARQIDNAQKANQSWLASIKQTIAGQQIGGKTLGEWAEQAKGFASRIGESAKAIGGATAAQRIFNTVLKASGIGLLVGILASVITYFTRLQAGMDKVSQVTAAFGAVINTVLVRIGGLGSAVVKLFSGDFSGAASDAKAAISGIGTAIVEAASAAYNLEKRIQALRDATITSSVEMARQRAQLENLKTIYEDDTRAIGQRIKVQREAAAIDTDIARKRFDEALEAQQIEQARFALSTKSAQDRQQFADAEIKLAEAKQELDRSILEGEQKARELRKQAAEESKKASEARKKQLEDERKALEALNKDLQKLRLSALGEGLDAELFIVNQKFDELAKTAQAGIAKLNEIESRRALTPDELAKRQEFADLAVKIEEQRLGALLDVITEFNEKENAIAEEQENRKRALAEKDLDRAIKSLEAEKALRDEQINLQEAQNERFLLELKRKGAKEDDIKKAEIELDRFVQAARLNNELQFQEALLALTDNGNTEQIAQIEATIATIKQKIGNLQIDQPGKKPKNIFELLGIDADGEEAIKQAVGQIIDGINQIAQARVDAAAAEVERIDELIAKREEAVNREAELAKAGLANDLTLEKERLSELKKQRDAAAKEEAKARRAQIALDTIQQAVSLVTASANIFKSLSGLGPFGIPLAIGLIAAMFGAFVAARARALKAAEAPKFRKGVKLSGPSHEAGGIDMVNERGQVVGEAEGDEWLIGTGPSREHDRFLHRLNKGEFSGVDLNEMMKSNRATNPASSAGERIRDMDKRRADASEARHWAALKAAYSEGSDRIVNAINEKAEILPWKGGYKRRVQKGNTIKTEIKIPAEN